MKYFQFNKLVRDKIVENMKKSGQKTIGVRTLKDKEYLEELKKKLREETEEFLNVKDKSKLKEELADIQEVIDYIKKVLNMKNSDFKKFKDEKIEKTGGFDKRIYLESVGIREDSEWLEYFMKNKDKYPETKI